MNFSSYMDGSSVAVSISRFLNLEIKDSVFVPDCLVFEEWEEVFVFLLIVLDLRVLASEGILSLILILKIKLLE